MLVVPGSLEGASPSPRRPETGEGLRPVKAVVCVFAAALRDRLREVSEEEAESADVERWARRLLGAGVVLRDRFRFLSLDLRLLFGVGDLCFRFLDSDSDLCFFFLELFFLSRRGELLSDLLKMGSKTKSFCSAPSLTFPFIIHLQKRLLLSARKKKA